MTTTQTPNTTPAGYMKNGSGHLVPLEQVRPIDQQRNELVIEIVQKAKALNQALLEFKDSTSGDIGAFIDLSAERYDVELGGDKGNVTLTSYDGLYRVQRAIHENISFDEGLSAAKALIDQCLDDWTKDSRSEVKALVKQAFRPNKKGELSTSRVLELTRLEIKDSRWNRAMQAIKDSIQVDGSKSYLRIYERTSNEDKFQQITLDIASV